jgi:hypothetical protein
MGSSFIDQYSLLHFSTGVIFRFLNINWLYSFLIHLIFEYVENTPTGIHFIDNYLTWWPGGKQKPDSLINSLSDTLFFMLGWIVANLVKN